VIPNKNIYYAPNKNSIDLKLRHPYANMLKGLKRSRMT
jgi:hypothetical protein